MGWLSDIGDAVSSAASAVGDFVEDTADAIVDTAEDVVDTVVDTVQDGIQAGADWLCENAGDVGCAIGNVLGGALDGSLQGLQDIAHDLFDIGRDAVGLVGSVLRLDLPGLLKGLGTLGLDLLDLFVDVGRYLTLGYLVGGIVRYFKRSMLRDFVEDLVQRTFGRDPPVLASVRAKTGLDGSKRFGYRLPAAHRVFMMDSRGVPLWQMHQNGELDLYALAHLLSFDSFAIGAANPSTVVKSVDADGNDNLLPVSRWTISHYLESDGRDGRLRVYAMSRQMVANKLNVAVKKLEEIAVILEWNDSASYPWFRGAVTTQPISRTEYDFNTDGLETLLARPEYGRPANVNCDLVTLAAFELERMGRVSGRDILECENFPSDCETPDRSDRCCVTVRRDRSSGIIYRDAWPSDIFAYVLPHEIGHYLGLCHCGHNGIQNVMYTKADDADLNFVDWGWFSFYWESEPHFSLEDGKNAWRFIVNQLPECIGAKPVPGRITRRETAMKAHSCAIPRDVKQQV